MLLEMEGHWWIPLSGRIGQLGVIDLSIVDIYLVISLVEGEEHF